jgi:hypothetical protein
VIPGERLGAGLDNGVPMSRAVIGSALILASILGAQPAQRLEGTLWTTRLSLDNQLDVYLDGVGQSSSWIVGGRVVEGTYDVAAGTGSIAPVADPMGARRLSDFGNQDVVTTYGSVRMDFKREASKGHLVILRLPRHARVRCFVDGIAVSDTVITSSFLIKDGLPLDEEVRGLGTLMLRLQQPKLPPPPPIIRRQDGRYVVSPALLRESLLGEAILATLPAAACGCTRVAGISVKLDIHGAVLDANRGFGDVEVGDVAAKSIRRWRFRPITDQSEPIDAEGLLMVRADPQGTLSVLW